MGGVYGPKQPQPVVLRLRIDGCTPLDLLRKLPNILRQQRRRRAVAKASETSLNAKFGTVPVHHRYITRMAKYGEPRPRPIGLGPPAKGCHARGGITASCACTNGGLDSGLRVRPGDA